MDAKEIKALLKQARESIKEKDFKAALKHCKAVLKVDNNNYNAWVFVGAAAQEIDQIDQAEAAFKRAIDISPDQILAWQGLCNFYEKHGKKEESEKLISVLEKLIELNKDKEKRVEICDKLISLIQNLDDKKKLVKAYKSKLEIVKDDSDQELSVQKQLFDSLLGVTDLEEDEKNMQIEALQILSCSDIFSEGYCKRIFKNCIEVLYKAGKENHSLNLAFLIYKNLPDSASCLEFLCRTAMDMYIYVGSVMDDIDKISDKLNTHTSLKSIALIFHGFVHLVSKNYAGAVEKLKEGLETLEYCLQGWYLLSKSYFDLHRYSDSVNCSKTGIRLTVKSKASSRILGKFYLLLGQALSGKENWDAAIKALHKSNDILGQSKESLVPFCLTLLKIEQIDNAEKICKELKVDFEDDAEILQVEGYICLLRKDYENALKKLRQSVALMESAYTLHLIGLILWETEQRDKAFKVFCKAVELDPYFAKNFLYLGHFYQYNLLDKSKAYLCYKKAFDLNSTDIEIGMSLSRILKDLGKEEENIQILKVITDQVSLSSCKWAWTQLGLYQLQKNSCSDAVYSLQKVVRADPNSSHAWECLADAYLKRGSYESALKAFEKSSELNPNAMYPLYQIASIQKARGFLIEAVEKYKNLLNTSTYVPAVIGLADTLISLAKKSFQDCLFGLTKDYCQESLYVLSRIGSSNSRLSCLWKLAGDACAICFHLDDKWFPITIPPELHQGLCKEPFPLNKSNTVAFSSKCFGRAISIKANVSSLWHDLGVSYYFQCLLSSSESENIKLAKKAVTCFRKAISITPNFEAHWTYLGVVVLQSKLKDYALGQHALIKSLQIKRNNAETWTNLGVLYLENEEKELANAAFSNAQSIEPLYPLSWTGQAIIAEQVNHYETTDLFRHATTLGSHEEALIGYSRIICETLFKNNSGSYNQEQMDTIIAAIDCITKFVANKNCSVEAHNILGILLERQGIYNASLKSYKSALNLVERTDKLEWKENVRANYARLLRIVGHPREAIKEYLLLKTVDMGLLCSFAYTFYKANELLQAFKLFGEAFRKSNSGFEKSHIKVAMAMIAKDLKDEKLPEPLGLLYESSQIKPASVHGLMALCAYGLLNNNPELALAAEKELEPYKHSMEYISSIAFLRATRAYRKKGIKAGRNELLKLIHCFPNQGNMWLQMASCLLQWNKGYANIAATCTKVGTFHNGNKEQASQILALCHLSLANRKDALSAAQKAVHINPGSLSNWVALAATCHSSNKSREHEWLFGFVKHLAKEQGIKPDLLGSLIVLESFHFICQNPAGTDMLVSKALTNCPFNCEVKSSLEILDAVAKVFLSQGNLDPLVVAVKNNPKSLFGWHTLCQVLLSSKRFSEAEKAISQFVLAASKIFPKWTSLALSHLAILSYKAMHVTPEDRKKWLKLGMEATGKAVHISPHYHAIRFLQGLFAIEAGNFSLAKRSFEKVLSNPKINESEWIKKASQCLLASKKVKGKDKK